MLLWHEFLAGWFDGAEHTLRTNPDYTQLIPEVEEITFQDQNLQKQLEGLYLHVTSERVAKIQNRWWSGASAKRMITENAKLNFWFRARVKTARTDGHNARSLVRVGADNLFAILSGANTTIPLQRRGMGAFRPQRGILVGGGEMAMRQVPVSVIYTYPSEAIPALPVDGGVNYRFYDGYLQFPNVALNIWYSVTMTGATVNQLGLSTGEGALYREDSGYFELYNSDSAQWVALRCVGDPVQFGLMDAVGLPVVPATYRFVDDRGIQLCNMDTFLYHTIGIAGDPSQFTISIAGET
jgi:hypothetical protein